MNALTSSPHQRRASDVKLPVTQDRSSRSRTVLLVEDETAIANVVARFLRLRLYDVEIAGTSERALDMLSSRRFAVVLCDIGLPGMSGVDLVPRALQLDPEVAIVMMTARNDATTATTALTRGAYDFLAKPVALADLGAAIDRALTRRAGTVQRRRSERLTRKEVTLRKAELVEERQALRAVSVSVVEALVNAMEAKQIYVRGHSQRVSALAGAIAEHLELEPELADAVRLAGRLQDVGKIGVRESVLDTPGTLSEDEVAHIRDHVTIGMAILAPLTHLGPTLTYIAHHHEHWDGGGYPLGLRGEEISIGGRILAAADAFEALTSGRAYRESMPLATALRFMETLVGTLLDPMIYEALRAVVVCERMLAPNERDSAVG